MSTVPTSKPELVKTPKRVTVPISKKQEDALNALSAQITNLQGQINAMLSILCADAEGEKKNVVGIEKGRVLIDVA